MQQGIAIAPTLSWNASPSASSYQVQVSTTSNFATTVFDQSGINTTSIIVSPELSNSTTYYWRVNSSNAGGTSGWSTVRSFTTMVFIPPIVSNGAGYALDFDGTDDYVNCGNNSSVQITGTAITMEAWIKPTKVGTMSIIKKTGGGAGYELSCAATGVVFCRFNDNANLRADGTTLYPTTGGWLHVAATFDGTNSRIYINGVLEFTKTFSLTNIINSINALTIAQDLSSSGKLFQGWIDEVRVWNIARSEADIKQI